MACLAAYNEGKLHGVWIDPLLGAEHIEAEVAKMIAKSPAYGPEEALIHDYEGFQGFDIGETGDWEFVAEVAELIDNNPLIAYLLKAEGYPETVAGLKEAQDYHDEHYWGKFESYREVAEELLNEQGLLDEVPECLRGWIDLQGYGEDLFGASGSFFEIEVVDSQGLTHRHAYRNR